MAFRKIKHRINPINGFNVYTIHYSCHPKATDPDGSVNKEWLKEEKSTMSELHWQRDMEINYTALGGELIWGSFIESKHVIEPITLNPNFNKARFLDYGFRNPTVCLWIAMDHEGRGYIYREWYHPTYRDMKRSAAAKIERYNLKQHAKIVLTLSRGEEYVTTQIDPQAAEVTFGSSNEKKSVIQQLSEAGLFCSKAKRSSTGLDTIEEMFRKDQLFIFSTCANTIEEIKNYRWADFSERMQQTRNLKETPLKKADHACNALKFYGNFKNKHTPKVKVKTLPTALAKSIKTEVEIAQKDIERIRKQWRPRRYSLR